MGAFLRIAPTDYETATVTGKIQPGGSPMEIPAAKPVKKSPAFSQSKQRDTEARSQEPEVTSSILFAMTYRNSEPKGSSKRSRSHADTACSKRDIGSVLFFSSCSKRSMLR